jgi:hypothetical protein
VISQGLRTGASPSLAGGAGLCPAGAQAAHRRVAGAKEGARGGTMGSPTSSREDALIMWREPSSEVKTS